MKANEAFSYIPFIPLLPLPTYVYQAPKGIRLLKWMSYSF